MPEPPLKRHLLRLGVHPVSGAWLSEDGDQTCSGCVFLVQRSRFSGWRCAQPSNLPPDPVCYPWLPACILRREP